MIRLRPAPCIPRSLLSALLGGVTVYALQRMTASSMEAANEGIAPDCSAMAVVAERAIFSEWQDTIEASGIIAPRQEDADVIISSSGTLDQVGQPGTELFHSILQNRLEWRAEIAASDLTKMAAGQKVEVDLPDGGVAVGVVRMISPIPIDASRRGTVYADLIDGSAARAGMYDRGRIILGARPALFVSATSVLVRDGRHYVAKLSGPENGASVSLVRVTIGRYSGDKAEITDGLSPGDTIVGKGAGRLADGDRVRCEPFRAREKLR